eukprot:6924219-Pyramimonas_sp.AAC.1
MGGCLGELATPVLTLKFGGALQAFDARLTGDGSHLAEMSRLKAMLRACRAWMSVSSHREYDALNAQKR